MNNQPIVLQALSQNSHSSGWMCDMYSEEKYCSSVNVVLGKDNCTPMTSEEVAVFLLNLKSRS
jgi:hypothetical protein